MHRGGKFQSILIRAALVAVLTISTATLLSPPAHAGVSDLLKKLDSISQYFTAYCKDHKIDPKQTRQIIDKAIDPAMRRVKEKAPTIASLFEKLEPELSRQNDMCSAVADDKFQAWVKKTSLPKIGKLIKEYSFNEKLILSALDEMFATTKEILKP